MASGNVTTETAAFTGGEMPIGSDEFVKWHHAQLSRYLSAPITASRAVAGAMRDRHLLPIGDDLAYVYLIDSSGQLYWEDALEPEAGVRPLSDTNERTTILRAYSTEHPVLANLLPPRPTTARDCRDCGGRGLTSARTTAGTDTMVACWACAGLGWLSDDSARAAT